MTDVQRFSIDDERFVTQFRSLPKRIVAGRNGKDLTMRTVGIFRHYIGLQRSFILRLETVAWARRLAALETLRERGEEERGL